MSEMPASNTVTPPSSSIRYTFMSWGCRRGRATRPRRSARARSHGSRRAPWCGRWPAGSGGSRRASRPAAGRRAGGRRRRCRGTRRGARSCPRRSIVRTSQPSISRCAPLATKPWNVARTGERAAAPASGRRRGRRCPSRSASRTSSARSGNAPSSSVEVSADAVGRGQLPLADEPLDAARAPTWRPLRRGRALPIASKYRLATSALDIARAAVYAARISWPPACRADASSGAESG